jgi:pimeloyl-ACP methyl ester carboxylesterase
MQKAVHKKKGSGTIARVLGLSLFSALILTIVVAIQHMLETPMRLESPLPGESHYYKWKHGYIFYKVLGESQAPPLLLLHSPGLVASAYEMRNIIEPLAQHYRVYAPDLIGFGISDRPSIEYSADIYIALCRDFLTDIIKNPATIVASRISCNYAVVTAAISPSLCERLVLISPVALEGMPEQASSLPSGNTNKIAFVSVWQRLLQVELVKWVVYPMLSTRFALRSSKINQQSPISDVDLDYFYATTHQTGAEHAPMASLARKLEQDVSHHLELIQQPTLVIWGARGLNDSRHIGSRQDISWMKAHTRLTLLSDAGLAVHEEQPTRVIATILSWRAEGKADIASKENATLEAYCRKCKMKRKMLNATEVTSKDGRMAVRGTCEACGSNLHRFGRLKQQTSA